MLGTVLRRIKLIGQNKPLISSNLLSIAIFAKSCSVISHRFGREQTFSNTRFGREHLGLNSSCINYKICCLENLHTFSFCLRIFWFFNLKNDIFQGTLPSIIWQLGWEGNLGANGWIHVYVWLSPFAVHLKLTQHY